MSYAITKYNPLSSSQSEEVLAPPYFEENGFVLYNADCLKVMAGLPENSIDMIFADPPYFLSNNGMTCKSGKMVSVNKGEPRVDLFRDYVINLKHNDIKDKDKLVAFATNLYFLDNKLVNLIGKPVLKI